MPPSKQPRSSLLPIELVEEILHKIPTESLVRFKSISKEWYALLSDQRFIYKHLDTSAQRLVYPKPNALTCLPIPDEFCGTTGTTIHCDGLLLCKYTERGRYCDAKIKLAVWNPILRRVKWIKPSNSYKFFDVYGFGYDNVSRKNYKILRFDNKFGKTSEVEIYAFKSKRWRSVDATETPSFGVYGYFRSRLEVSLDGNMYWVAHQKKMVDSETVTFIQSFDFSTETFKPICRIPDMTCVGFHKKIVALSGFEGDRLSLLYQYNIVKIEVWVTNKVTDAVVSLSKYFNVTGPHLPVLNTPFQSSSQTLFIHKTNKIMLWCVEVDDKYKRLRANVYELGEGQISKQVETGQWNWYDRPFLSYCDVYVRSLVPVPN